MPNHDKRPRLAALSLTILGALSSLAAGQSVANNSANNPSLNCVSVQVGQLQASDANFATSLGLSIKNGCGKDISAVGINFGPNQVTQWDWIEMLLFKDQLPENGILLTGTTKQLWIPRDWIPVDATWTPTVSFVIFMDRTALGDATAISRRITTRQNLIVMYEERKELLASLTASGQTISPEAISSFLEEHGETLQSSGRSYLAHLRENLGRVDPSDWPSLIDGERERANAGIALLKLHSQISIQAAAPTEVAR